MKVAPAEGSVSPSLKLTSIAPIGGRTPSAKVTLPVAPTEGKGNLEAGQTSTLVLTRAHAVSYSSSSMEVAISRTALLNRSFFKKLSKC